MDINASDILSQMNLLKFGVGFLVGTAIFIFARKKFREVMTEVKEHLFTPHGFIIALLLNLLTVGVLASMFFVNVYVLGNDPKGAMVQQEQASSTRKGK